MARIENARRTILTTAETLLQDRGFNGFSYAHIAAELGVKNAAVHYHFPTKGDLAVAVVRRYRDRFGLWTRNARVANLPPERKLDWFFSIYTDLRADRGKVCLVGSLEAEFNALPEALQTEVETLHREMLHWLEAVLHEGRAAGVFRFAGDPTGKASLIMSGVQGALQMARALGTKKFREVIKQIRLDLTGAP